MTTRTRFDHWQSLEIKPRNYISTPRRVLKILLNLFLFSMVIIFFWGMGTIFFNTAVQTTTVPISNTSDKVDYVPRVFFEISSGFEDVINDPNNNINTYKHHIFYLDSDGTIKEHRYYLADSFSSMWNISVSASYVLFVLPVTWLLTKLALAFGWTADALGTNPNLLYLIAAIFVVTLLLRILSFASTWNQKKQQKIMENLKQQTAAIKAKYADSTDPMAKQREKQETMLLYRQYNINPLSSALQGFAFAPVLITIFIAVRYGRIIKESSTEAFSLTQSIWSSLSTNLSANAIYLLPAAVYVILFAFDLFLGEYLFKVKPKIPVPATNKKGNRQKWIKWGLRIMFFVFFFIVPTGTSIYWIFSTFFEIIQKVLVELFLKLKSKKAALRKRGINIPLWKLAFLPSKVK